MTVTNSESTRAPQQSDLHLPFLDGMRGLAALYVAVFHNVYEYSKNLGGGFAYCLGWLRHGGYAVDVFIVLSGFCLMMPAARHPQFDLRGGLRLFFVRRAWRILPAYYAALLLTWALLLVSSQGVALVRGQRDADLLVNFHPENVISHLLLFHNFYFRWNMGIDFPLWSIATEWQIYFIFALILLPLCRSWGIGISVCVGCLIGIAPRLLLPAGQNLDWAAPWLLGLFAFGMAGAVIGFSKEAGARKVMESIPWGLAAIILFVGVNIYNQQLAIAGWSAVFEANLVGLATVCFILFCIQSQRKGRRNAFVRILQARWTVLLGLMSYSLYLTHAPAMFKIYPLMNSLHLSPSGSFFFRVLFGIPWMLFVAALFYRFVEHPSMLKQKSISSRRSGHNISVQPDSVPCGGLLSSIVQKERE